MLGSRDGGDACGAPTGPLGASETAAEATGDGYGGFPLPTDTMSTASPITPWPISGCRLRTLMSRRNAMSTQSHCATVQDERRC